MFFISSVVTQHKPILITTYAWMESRRTAVRLLLRPLPALPQQLLQTAALKAGPGSYGNSDRLLHTTCLIAGMMVLQAVDPDAGF